ncbi:MAG: hypothetical protein ACTHL8_11235 [Burkholderiaceae bacterium]
MAAAYEDRPGYEQTKDVLFRIKRGLVSYVSYLAACEMNEAFSEYVLYEPILRILMARGFSVECEVECPGIEHAPVGDKKRLDFVAHNDEIEFALEVKWINHSKMSVTRDVEKLQAYVRERPNSLGLICLFGKQSVIDKFKLPRGFFWQRGRYIVAELVNTKYACRIYQLYAE